MLNRWDTFNSLSLIDLVNGLEILIDTQGERLEECHLLCSEIYNELASRELSAKMSTNFNRSYRYFS